GTGGRLACPRAAGVRPLGRPPPALPGGLGRGQPRGRGQRPRRRPPRPVGGGGRPVARRAAAGAAALAARTEAAAVPAVAVPAGEDTSGRPVHVRRRVALSGANLARPAGGLEDSFQE